MVRGGDWIYSPCFIFSDIDHRLPSSPLVRSILRAWDSMRKLLVHIPPWSAEEANKQPIMWNDLILDSYGRPLGAAIHIQQVGWVAIFPTVLDWKRFKSLTEDERVVLTQHLRGTNQRIVQIDAAIPNH